MANLVDTFVEQAIVHSDFEEMDRLYLRNRVLALVGEQVLDIETELTDMIALKDALLASALEAGQVGELLEEQDMVGASLMDLVTPAPSQVNRQFWATYENSPEQAIADFYDLSKRNDYIKLAKISITKYRQIMAIWKSPSTCPNQRRIRKPLRRPN